MQGRDWSPCSYPESWCCMTFSILHTYSWESEIIQFCETRKWEINMELDILVWSWDLLTQDDQKILRWHCMQYGNPCWDKSGEIRPRCSGKKGQHATLPLRFYSWSTLTLASRLQNFVQMSFCQTFKIQRLNGRWYIKLALMQLSYTPIFSCV